MAAKKAKKKARIPTHEALKARREAQIKSASGRADELTAEQRAWVEAKPSSSRRKKKTKKKVVRKRSAQLNVRLDDDLVAALRDIAKRREGQLQRPWVLREIVELALVEWLERADKRRGKRGKAKALADLRALAEELQGL